jgi:hypothetical protein
MMILIKTHIYYNKNYKKERKKSNQRRGITGTLLMITVSTGIGTFNCGSSGGRDGGTANRTIGVVTEP